MPCSEIVPIQQKEVSKVPNSSVLIGSRFWNFYLNLIGWNFRPESKQRLLSPAKETGFLISIHGSESEFEFEVEVVETQRRRPASIYAILCVRAKYLLVVNLWSLNLQNLFYYVSVMTFRLILLNCLLFFVKDCCYLKFGSHFCRLVGFEPSSYGVLMELLYYIPF